jgi:hypothetical protein
LPWLSIARLFMLVSVSEFLRPSTLSSIKEGYDYFGGKMMRRHMASSGSELCRLVSLILVVF